MSMMIKYKVSEVAKDFAVSPKQIIEILGKYGSAPKSNSQSLTEEELNIVFDHMTYHNQIGSLAEVFAPAAAAAEARKQATEDRLREQERQRTEAIREKERAQEAAALRKPQKEQAKARPKTETLKMNPNAKEQQPAQSAVEQSSTKAPKVHYVDTRGSSVNTAKYDDRAEKLVTEKADKMSNQQNKQKLTKKADLQKKQQFQGARRRQEEQERLKKLEQQAAAKKVPLKVEIPDEIAVGELAQRLKKTAAEVIKQLMKLGVMASVSQNIDYDTASLVAMELGAEPSREVVVTIEERLFDEREDTAEELVERAPVVVVMGHVDHGKTSLLDAIRQTRVTAGEAGGITQHIGAYRVNINDRDITFLDTPGHAAVTSLRARGAQVTDVAILVVAADDGIMPQTIEAINHAKAAEVPIIVAVNKMDKPTANPDRIMQQLTEYELVPEEWGGSTIVCPISALKHQGIDNLLEMVLLTADMAELKANPNRAAKGTVIEARLDKGRGPVATVLIQNGTLKSGDIVIAGTAVGRVRAMTNDRGRRIDSAGPSVPVEIVGLAEVPGAGDILYAVEDERMARTLAEKRRAEEKALQQSQMQKVTLENLFSSIESGNVKDLNIIVKADVQGSAEAVRASLEKIGNEEVRVRVIHCGVGGINESDVMLANASNAIIVGFNVRPEAGAAASAAASNVDMRMYRVIYEAIEEVEQAMKGMLAPKFREAVIGHAQVRQTFKVSGVGTIAGCYVTDGKMQRGEKVRIVRDSIVVHEGDLATLKRFKDEVKEVATGYECGLSFENYNDIKEGDIIEAFIMEEVKR